MSEEDPNEKKLDEDADTTYESTAYDEGMATESPRSPQTRGVVRELDQLDETDEVPGSCVSQKNHKEPQT